MQTPTISLGIISRELAEIRAREKELKQRERSIKAYERKQKQESDMMTTLRRRKIATQVNYGPANLSLVPTDLRHKVSKFMSIGDFHEYTCGCVVANYTIPAKYHTGRHNGTHQVRRECHQHDGTTEPKHVNQLLVATRPASPVGPNPIQTDTVNKPTDYGKTHLECIRDSKANCRRLENQLRLIRSELREEHRRHADLILQTKVESDPLATKVLVSQFPWSNKAIYEQVCVQEGV